MAYNGWSTRATWNVVLWIGNDEPMYRRMQEAHPIGGWSPELAREFAESVFGFTTPDNCKLAEVDWQEVAEAWNEG